MQVGRMAVLLWEVVPLRSQAGFKTNMTTIAPSATPQAAEAPVPTARQYIRYLFYKARPSWRQLGGENPSL